VQLRDVALAAREAGFAGIWTWDHLAGGVHRSERVLECWTVLTALAVVVADMSVGPMVLNVANRHPAIVATMAATLQEVTGGRVLLGLGAGGGGRTPYAGEQVALGRDVAADPVRRERLAEAVEVIRRVWTGETSTFDGRHYTLRPATGFPRPVPPPPIVVGAFGHKMAELAGRVGDGINVQAFHPRVDDLIATARRAFAERGGPPASFLVTAFAGLDERWLDHRSPERSRLASLGVDRLLLVVDSSHDPREIEAAGRLLARSRG